MCVCVCVCVCVYMRTYMHVCDKIYFDYYYLFFFIIEILLLVFIVYPKIQVIISMNSPMEHALIGVDCTVDLVVWKFC